MLDEISKQIIKEADVAYKRGHINRAKILLETVNKLYDEIINRVMNELPNYITEKNFIDTKKDTI